MKNFTTVKRPAMNIIGIECRTSNAPDAGPKDIQQLWGRFFSEDILNKIPNKASQEIVALYCDYDGDYTQPYSFVIGCRVSSLDHIPKGMAAKSLPATSYAVFRAIGEHPQSVIETWGKIWSLGDLPRTYTGDYELYGDKFMSGSPKEVEVFIATRQESGHGR